MPISNFFMNEMKPFFKTLIVLCHSRSGSSSLTCHFQCLPLLLSSTLWLSMWGTACILHEQSCSFFSPSAHCLCVSVFLVPVQWKVYTFSPNELGVELGTVFCFLLTTSRLIMCIYNHMRPSLYPWCYLNQAHLVVAILLGQITTTSLNF